MPRPKRGRAVNSTATKPIPARSPSRELGHDRGDAENHQEGVRGRSRRTRSAGRLSLGEEEAIQAANRTRDIALKKLANEDATTTTSGPTAGDEGSESPVEFGRRAMATPAQHRRDTTGLDLGDSVFGDLDDSFGDGDIPDGSRSNDISTASYTAFRSGSRQSSFIGRNDPPIRPSSRGGTTPGVASSFNIGLFRRRAREPSILGTTRKTLQEPSKTAADSELESGDDFEPEAESTPLRNRRETHESKEIRKEGSPEVVVPSNSRKRKSDDFHRSNARPEKVLRTEADSEPEPPNEARDDSSSNLPDVSTSPQPEPQPERINESDSELSDLDSPPEPPGLLPRPVTPMNDEEVTAPPASSGSEGDDIWPDIRALAKKRRRPSIHTPTRLDNLSDMSSPPSLTYSPNFEDSRAAKTRGRQATRLQVSPKLTTADLTGLLPKRRYKKQRDPLSFDSDEELDTTGLGDEDDELSYLDTRAARRRKNSRPSSRAGSARPASRGGRLGNSALKVKMIPGSAKSSRQRRSFARHSSDKENQGEEDDVDQDEAEDDEEESRFLPLADDTFEVEHTAAAESLSADELKQASKKFQEVDKWELEFEEVTEASSPQDGR